MMDHDMPITFALDSTISSGGQITLEFSALMLAKAGLMSTKDYNLTIARIKAMGEVRDASDG